MVWLLTLEQGILAGIRFREGGVDAFVTSVLVPPVDECVEVVVLAAPGMRILIQSGSYFDALITKGLEQDFVCRSVGWLLPWYNLPLIHQFQPDLGDDTLLILGEALHILP